MINKFWDLTKVNWETTAGLEKPLYGTPDL